MEKIIVEELKRGFTLKNTPLKSQVDSAEEEGHINNHTHEGAPKVSFDLQGDEGLNIGV